MSLIEAIGSLSQTQPSLPPVIDALAGWSNLTSSAAIITLVIWLVTKGMPSLLDRHDRVENESRKHYEMILERIDERRVIAAKEGHDAASRLSESIDRTRMTLAENTDAVRHLTMTVSNK